MACVTVFTPIFAAFVMLLRDHPVTSGGCPLLQLGVESNYTAENISDMTGKVILITGANSGLGFASAKALARAGATVLLACRTKSKCETAAEQVRSEAKSKSGKVEVYNLDTASLAKVRTCASDVKKKYGHLDVLMLNAGINRIGGAWAASDDTQVELTMATNHLGHFLLVELLTPILGSGSRIVIMSSSTMWFAEGLPLTAQEAREPSFYSLHSRSLPNSAAAVPESYRSNPVMSLLMEAVGWLGHFIWTMNDPSGYASSVAYANSKLANMAHAAELAERLKPRGIQVIAVHPGMVKTQLSDMTVIHFTPGVFKDLALRMCDWVSHPMLGVFWRPEAGAYAQIFAASAPEVSKLKTGSYLIPHGRIGQADTRALDVVTRKRFWALSEELTAQYREE